MKLCFSEILMATSSCLDFVEMDNLGATLNHSKRVAYLSLRLGQHLGLDESEQQDLFAASLLHDNGLAQDAVGFDDPREYKDIQNRERLQQHCAIGAENLASLPVGPKAIEAVKYHHEYFDGSGNFGLSGSNIPIAGQIISLTDGVDNRFHFEKPNVGNRQQIVDFVRSAKNKLFTKELVQAFLDISSSPAFWLDLQEPYFHIKLHQLAPKLLLQLSWKELYGHCKVFSRIVDGKSRFTARHSSGLTEKAEQVAIHLGMDEDQRYQFMISASLHDLGKLAIPNRILNKSGPLTKDEFSHMQSHTYLTRKALEQVQPFEELTEWSANHHEKLDGSGYPYGFKAEALCFEARLMSVLDIYQALTEDRPYRKGMSPEKTSEIIKEQVHQGFLDPRASEVVNQVFLA